MKIKMVMMTVAMILWFAGSAQCREGVTQDACQISGGADNRCKDRNFCASSTVGYITMKRMSNLAYLTKNGRNIEITYDFPEAISDKAREVIKLLEESGWVKLRSGSGVAIYIFLDMGEQEYELRVANRDAAKIEVSATPAELLKKVTEAQ